MTLKELQSLPLYMSRGINAAIINADTFRYIQECLREYYSGNYGEVPPEDVELNNADLASGTGHVLARYPAKHSLKEDIYIESHFYDAQPLSDLNYNNTVVCYVSER